MVEDGEDRVARAPSRSQKKRDAQAVARLGLRLIELGPSELSPLPLDEALRAEILVARRLTKNARSRQLRLLAKMLRERDLSELLAALSRGDRAHRLRVAVEQLSEEWRGRLMEEGDLALSPFLQAYPAADSGLIRALMRQIRKLPEGARKVRAKRELLRAIRQACQPEAPGVGSDLEP